MKLAAIFTLIAAFHITASPPASFTYSLQAGHLADSREEAIATLRDSDRDWLIIDYSFYGDHDTRWTPEEIAAIRAGKDGRKVIAYLSIGEAASYRFYWDQSWDPDADGQPAPEAPDWLLSANPDWPDNYRVQYWRDEWKSCLSTYLTEILATGFDGIWYDTISTFEVFEHNPETNEWIDNRPNPATGNTYREDMVTLANSLTAQARKENPDFLVIPNNAEQLLAFPDYADTLSAQGLEDLFTNGNWIMKPKESEWRLSHLTPAHDRNLSILLIEYGEKESAQEHSKKSAADNAIQLLLTDRKLKTLGEMATE